MTQAICCGIIFLIAAADQLIKHAVLSSSLVGGSVTTVIESVLQLRYVENTGAAFSILENKTAFLSVFTAVVLAFGFYLILSKKVKSKLAKYGYDLEELQKTAELNKNTEWNHRKAASD